MRQINLDNLLRDLVRSFQSEQKNASIPFFLTIPYNLPPVPWIDNSLETLIFTICDCVISKSYLGTPVRIAVNRKADISDLNELIMFCPSGWFQLKIEMQSPSELGKDIREKLKDLHYRCIDEWTNESSTSRLIAYGRANQADPHFLFWIQRHKASHRYILLIPVNEQGKST
jgi:hypothetical protein